MTASTCLQEQPLRVYELKPRRCRHGVHADAADAARCMDLHPDEWGFEASEVRP